MQHLAMWEFVLDNMNPKQHALAKKGVMADGVKSSSSSSSSDDDNEKFDAAKALADRMFELKAYEGIGPEPFFWVLRGGAWTWRRGVAYDNYREQARGGLASEFCRLHALPLSATFSIARYGEEHCLFLLRFWIYRMTFLYSVWYGQGSNEALRFTPAMVVEYRVSAELDALLHVPQEETRFRARETCDRLPRDT